MDKHFKRGKFGGETRAGFPQMYESNVVDDGRIWVGEKQTLTPFPNPAQNITGWKQNLPHSKLLQPGQIVPIMAEGPLSQIHKYVYRYRKEYFRDADLDDSWLVGDRSSADKDHTPQRTMTDPIGTSGQSHRFLGPLNVKVPDDLYIFDLIVWRPPLQTLALGRCRSLT